MNRFGLRIRIVVAAVLVALVPFLICMALLFSQISRSFLDLISNYSDYTTQVIGKNVERVMEAADTASLYPFVNPQIIQFLKADAAQLAPADYQQIERDALLSIGFLPFTTDEIRYYAIQSLDGRVLSASPGYYVPTSGDIERATALQGRALWNLEHQYWTTASNRDTYITLTRLLRDPQRVSIHLGVVKLYIDAKTIAAQLQPLAYLPTVKNYVLDASGQLLISPDKSAPPFEAIDPDQLKLAIETAQPASLGGEQYLMNASPLGESGWMVVSLMPYAYIGEYLSHFRWIILIAVSAFLLASVLLSMIFSHFILRPVREISRLMMSVADEDFTARASVHGQNEIAVLQTRFNSMNERLEKLHNETYMYNIRLREAQIQELQSRINPHFLSNTLTSIYWISELNGLTELSAMVSSLSSLFKITLTADEGGFVPLEKECLHLGHYITIQNIRFRDSIRFEVDQQPGNEHCSVLALLLQPLVENAISHGLEPQEGGTVRIRTFRDGDMLVYTVEDDGVGMDEAYFQQLTTTPGAGTGASGMALRNIADRLRLKFGPPYGLFYQRKEEGGSLFTICQPYIKREV